MLFHTAISEGPSSEAFNGLLASFTETQALGRVHKKPCALIAANAVWCKDMLQLTHILLLILEEVDACSSSIALCKVLLKGRMCCPSLDGQTISGNIESRFLVSDALAEGFPPVR